MLYSEEQIQRANERSISEYFRLAGYSCKRVGSETHIEGFGGFYVNDTTIPNKFYIHSQQKGGVGLVNCLMKVMDMPFKEAVRAALDGELGQEDRADSVPKYAPHFRRAEPSVPEPKPEFIMPEKGENDRRVFSYLTKTRHIDADVVNAFIREGVLFQDTKGNAVFLHKENGKPCGAEIHGTSGKSYTVGNSRYADFSADRKVIPTEPYIAEMLGREMNESGVRFAGYVYEKNANIVTDSAGFEVISRKIAEIQNRSIDKAAIDSEVKSKLKNYNGVAPGTSESFFSYDKGEPRKAFVFESSIDLMSFIALHPEVTDCKFVAMAGLKPNVVEKLLASGLDVTLCVDNDQAGKNFCKQFGGRCKCFVECMMNNVKDFNELLVIDLNANTIHKVMERLRAEGIMFSATYGGYRNTITVSKADAQRANAIAAEYKTQANAQNRQNYQQRTNAVESYHRMVRKFTKSKAVFPTDDSIRKVIFMSVKEISKKWTMPVRDWGLAYSQFAIFFEDRFAA